MLAFPLPALQLHVVVSSRFAAGCPGSNSLISGIQVVALALCPVDRDIDMVLSIGEISAVLVGTVRLPQVRGSNIAQHVPRRKS